jgi:single-strand DNA-binding protein
VTELKLPEVNRVLLSGRLTRDPDARFAVDGTPITQLDLAFHRRTRGRDGQATEQTGFVTVMTYQRLAEVCSQYLKKGSAVLVEGRLQMREWVAAGGAKRQRLELRAESVHFLERGLTRTSGADEEPAAPSPEGELF